MSTSESSAILASGAATTVPNMHLVFRSIRRALLYIALSIAAFISIFPVLLDGRGLDELVARHRSRQDHAGHLSVREHRRLLRDGRRAAHVLELDVSRARGRRADPHRIVARRLRLRGLQVALPRSDLRPPPADALDPVRRAHGPALHHDVAAQAHQHVRCGPAARHRFDLHHLLLPPGDEGLSGRAPGCRAHRWAQRVADLRRSSTCR